MDLKIKKSSLMKMVHLKHLDFKIVTIMYLKVIQLLCHPTLEIRLRRMHYSLGVMMLHPQFQIVYSNLQRLLLKIMRRSQFNQRMVWLCQNLLQQLLCKLCQGE